MTRYEIKDGCLLIWIPLRGLPVKADKLKRCGNFTRRQMQVFRELKKGKTNKEIASVLGVTERTIKFHVSALMMIVGLHSRHLLALADVESPMLEYMMEENKSAAFGSRREMEHGSRPF